MARSEALWQGVEPCGKEWGIVARSGALWQGVGHCGKEWSLVARSGVGHCGKEWGLVARSGALWNCPHLLDEQGSTSLCSAVRSFPQCEHL